MSLVETVIGDGQSVDPMKMLYALRLMFAIASWVLTDMAVDRLSVSKNERIKGLLFVSTSYVTWTYQSHTFSNSIETIVLLWCLVIIHEFEHIKTTAVARHWDIGLLGVLVAIGVFNRVTFPAFLVLPALRLRHVLPKYPLMVVTFVVCCALTASGCIWIDTMTYGSDSYVLAPLNNLAYNTDVANLALHGLHSRLHHILVNLPTLMGPGLVLLLSTRYVRTISFEAAVSGIAILSLVPHQEARFLVPVVPLLCCAFDPTRWGSKHQKALITGWLAFNVFMGALMGVIHQGGVIPAQAFIGSNGADLFSPGLPATVAWWKTYSPPIWILGRPDGTVTFVEPAPTGDNDYERYADVISAAGSRQRTNSTTDLVPPHMTVLDLMGAPDDIMMDVLRAATHNKGDTFLVAPRAAVHSSPGLVALDSDQMAQVWSTRLHVSLESMTFSSLAKLDFGLSVYKMGVI